MESCLEVIISLLVWFQNHLRFPRNAAPQPSLFRAVRHHATRPSGLPSPHPLLPNPLTQTAGSVPELLQWFAKGVAAAGAEASKLEFAASLTKEERASVHS